MIKRPGIFLILIVFVFAFLSSAAHALISPEQKRLLDAGVLWYDLDACEDATGGECVCTPEDAVATNAQVPAGQGSPKGNSFPNLDPGAMSRAIDKYISQNYSNSRMNGLGSTIVAGASNSNINPFLIVALAQHESGMANPSDYNIRHGSNAFGRTATTSQPNFKGARLWYYWSSVKASVDHTAEENQKSNVGDIASYLRNSGFYDEALAKDDLTQLMMTYAPPHENNTANYVNVIKQTTNELIKLTNQEAGNSSGSDDLYDTTGQLTISNNYCCQVTGDEPVALGSSVKAALWNMLTQDMKLTATQAAGIMGNIQQESNFSLTAENTSTKAYGLVQWYAGRKTKLSNYASEQGKPISDLSVQLEYLKIELEGAYNEQVTKPIKASNNMAEITRIFLERFEIPCLPGSSECDKEMNIRLPNAQEIYKEFAGANATINTPIDVVNAGACKDSSLLIDNILVKQLPVYMTTPGGKITPKGITLHWWGSNGDGGIDFLARALRGNTSCGSSGCSVQIGITKEGEVYQMTKDMLDLTYHAAGANSTTIGIEIEGGPADFGKEGIEKYPKKYAAVVATVKMLMEKYKIPLTGRIECGNVTGIHSHKDLKACGNAGKTDIDDYYFNKVIADVEGV